MRTQLFFLLSLALSTPAWAGAAAPAPAAAAFVERADCARPAWPKESLERGEQGTVTLALLVEANGKVSASKVVKSSGFRALDAATLAAMAKCTYQPQVVVRGEAQMGWQLLQYVWMPEAAR